MTGNLMFDPLSAFFLICFGVGLLTSVGALLLGSFHSGGIGHGGDITHGGGISHGGDITHGGDIAARGGATYTPGGSASAGAGAGVGQGSGPSAQAAHGVSGQNAGSPQVSFLNVNTLLGFLVGFGAVGFAVQNVWSGIPLLWILLAAAAGGLVFAYIIYWVLVNILIKGQSEYLWAGDFNLVGMEGSVSSTIFAGHWGEVSYVLNHNRAAIPARERNGREVRKGETVIIIEVDEGVAVVLPKEEFMQYTGKMEG
ncbi:hypothetical protein CEB3_c38660 [Peptococcaceae bacterium CEB3]|nr:hypothetical protein CEB3_c38660 [Peptococcaceae bacterium CEB3]